MSSFSPNFVKSLVSKIFPSLRKTQTVNLSYAVFGLIKSQSALMSEIVREVPGAKKHKHRLKRLWRFLSNPRVKPERLRVFWICWIIKTFSHEKIIKVAMDWTTLPGNIQCLMIAIPFKGRAIPLLWHITLHKEIKDSQNMIEERLVARLVTLVTETFPDKKLFLTADRGFGRAELFKFLLKKEVLFVIRVKSDVHITTKDGKKIQLRELGKTLKERIPVLYKSISYRQDRVVKGVHLVAVVALVEGKDADPWFLITNISKPERTIKLYAERFHIEEWFKDLKHQLGIAALQTKELKRVRRMVLVAAVAYGLTMIIGKTADRLKKVKDELITGGKKSGSCIWFAVKLIRHKLVGKAFWRRVYLQALSP